MKIFVEIYNRFSTPPHIFTHIHPTSQSSVLSLSFFHSSLFSVCIFTRLFAKHTLIHMQGKISASTPQVHMSFKKKIRDKLRRKFLSSFQLEIIDEDKNKKIKNNSFLLFLFLKSHFIYAFFLFYFTKIIV